MPLVLVCDNNQLSVSTARHAPSVTSTGREQGAVWSDLRAGDLDIFFTRLSPEGARVGSDLRLTGP